MLEFLLQHLAGGVPEARSLADGLDKLYLQDVSKQGVSPDKLKSVIRNSAFGDLLYKVHGIEFSCLSYVIEGSIWLI